MTGLFKFIKGLVVVLLFNTIGALYMAVAAAIYKVCLTTGLHSLLWLIGAVACAIGAYLFTYYFASTRFAAIFPVKEKKQKEVAANKDRGKF